MSITEIASSTNRPKQGVGTQFLNPAVLMRLVRVMKGEKTSEAIIHLIYDLTLRTNKVLVKVAKDSIGFVHNQVSAPTQIWMIF